MDQVLADLHNGSLADGVVGGTLVLLLLASCAFAWKRPSAVRLAVAFLTGAVITALTIVAASVDRSGTLIRTRYGLPHFLAERSYDHDTCTTTEGFTLLPSYALVNLAFWCALTILVAALTSRANRTYTL